MKLTEPVIMALASIGSNKLRTGLTLLSIAIGVFAIVGVAIAASALQRTLTGQLESMGTTTFSIQRMPAVSMGHSWRLYRNRPDITVREATNLKRRMGEGVVVSLRRDALGKSVRYGDKTTDPNVTVVGSDEGWSYLRDFPIDEGRTLTWDDVQSYDDVAVIGSELSSRLFGSGSGIGRTIAVDGHRYRIIGSFASKGASMSGSMDNFVLIPITSATKYFFDEWASSVSITIRPEDARAYDETLSRAVVEMRRIRRVSVGMASNFEVETNESISETFSELTNFAEYFGLACGMIALLAAGVGIMNIMLVSVKERTREIGVRKALGATRLNILYQFLVEALTLWQLGALIGIGLGIAGGAALALAMETAATIPWSWVAVSFCSCTAIGLAFGLYPAWRAARLDPIEALRYE